MGCRRYDPGWSFFEATEYGFPVNEHVLDLGTFGGLFSACRWENVRAPSTAEESLLERNQQTCRKGLKGRERGLKKVMPQRLDLILVAHRKASPASGGTIFRCIGPPQRLHMGEPLELLMLPWRHIRTLLPFAASLPRVSSLTRLCFLPRGSAPFPVAATPHKKARWLKPSCRVRLRSGILSAFLFGDHEVQPMVYEQMAEVKKKKKLAPKRKARCLDGSRELHCCLVLFMAMNRKRIPLKSGSVSALCVVVLKPCRDCRGR